MSAQRHSGSRVTLSNSEKTGAPPSSGSATDPDPVVRRSSGKKQAQQSTQSTKDPLYSLSSASIRARKNALETENIQRASLLYTDYIAKIKAFSMSNTMESELASKITATYLSENDPASNQKMDVDTEGSKSDPAVGTGSSSTTSANDPSHSSDESPLAPPQATLLSNDSGSTVESGFGPIEGLKYVQRSGVLHSLIRQYFTLVHPQFAILHKNHFLVRFWADYDPFPEAKEIHIQILQHAKPDNVWHGPVEDPASRKGDAEKSNPLLLLAMMALVSRHIIDRTHLKSTAIDKQRRIEKNLALMKIEFQSSTDRDHFYQEKAQESAQEVALQELMETDELGQSIIGENLKDLGEQYFQWASELLKAEYEEPSLMVVQSLLLLREYAAMAGNHTQAYMHGGAAITMAISLGWHNTHLVQPPQREESVNTTGQTTGTLEEKAERDKQQENRVKEEEQRLCWWHCFIIDRWMSAAYNRPVVSVLLFVALLAW